MLKCVLAHVFRIATLLLLRKLSIIFSRPNGLLETHIVLYAFK